MPPVVAATSSGIFKTTDGGATWYQVSNNTQNYKDIAVHPTNPDIIYCTGQGRFNSEDAGEDWEYINDGIVPSTRMVIAADSGSSGKRVRAVSRNVRIPRVLQIRGSRIEFRRDE